jgi:hypothetical protein
MNLKSEVRLSPPIDLSIQTGRAGHLTPVTPQLRALIGRPGRTFEAFTQEAFGR